MKCYSLFVLLVSHSVSPASCLDCFSCQHVDDPAHCNTSAVCGQNEFCYLDGHQGSYSMGCSSSQNCGAAAGSLVGRSITELQIKHLSDDYNAKKFETRQTINCHECCSTDGCNKDLCKHLKPTQCVDDESVDCARMSTLFSICQDIHKAKYVCPRFCNLCDLVDGQWGQWTAWSECDVTCDTGVRTRSRSCTNPSPANGGLDCVGKKIETLTCHKDACPVHGGWSGWSDWGSCSATCDIGLERRDRTCTNPRPSNAGDHCYGDVHEDRICMSAACTDGAWSGWSSWGSCSETCGVGIRSKTRTCSNPKPSILGKHCDGTSVGVSLCNKQACPDDKIAFTAYGLASGANRTIRFPNTLLNYGAGYNSTTGIFTCATPGIYHFAVTFTMSPLMDDHVFRCYLKVNNSEKLYIEGHKGTSDAEALEYSAAGSFHLNKNDIVYISDSLLVLSDANNDKSSSFTGVLVTPDM